MGTDKEMLLPEGKTCANCRHFERCSKMYGAHDKRQDCDFYPNKFQDSNDR